MLSPDLQEFLRGCGWYPGRCVEDSVLYEWLRKYKLEYGVYPFPEAVRVLREFGGLLIGNVLIGPSEEWTSGHHEGFMAWEWEMEEVFFPIAQDLDDVTFEFRITPTGKVFATGICDLYCGDSFEEFLANICPLVGKRVNWYNIDPSPESIERGKLALRVKKGIEYKGSVAVLRPADSALKAENSLSPSELANFVESSADIAFGLLQMGTRIATPAENPDPTRSEDWSFPDSEAGIEAAIESGARFLWANTLLHRSHPLTHFRGRHLKVIGQIPANAERVRDKWAMNQLLSAAGCPLPKMARISALPGLFELSLQDLSEGSLGQYGLTLPLTIKPSGWRSGEGFVEVKTLEEMRRIIEAIFASKPNSDCVIVEELLQGEEIVIAVVPPGVEYNIQHWYKVLRPLLRSTHEGGLKPIYAYDPLVVERYKMVRAQCELAAQTLGARAPIVVDCRAGVDGKFRIVDLDMQPQFPGCGRPGRDEQVNPYSFAFGNYAESLEANAGRAWEL